VNLKLGGNRSGGKGPGPSREGAVVTEGNKFFVCGPDVDLIQLCIKKDVAAKQSSGAERGIKGATPLEAETIGFCTFNESCKCAFLIFGNAKNYRYNFVLSCKNDV